MEKNLVLVAHPNSILQCSSYASSCNKYS